MTEAMRAAEVIPVVTESEERALLRRAAQGDAEAFGPLVLRYQGPVLAACHRQLRRPEDAEDAAQETFLRAWRAMGSFDVAKSFLPWLLTIASNTAANHAQRSGRRHFAESRDVYELAGILPSGGPSPARIAAGTEAVAAVERAVADLPPDAAQLFRLRYGDSLSVEEVATRLGKTANATAVSLHRIREKIRHLVFGDES